MPSLKPVHWKVLKCIFEHDGFVQGRAESGSHITMNKPGVNRPVVIPKRAEIHLDIIKSNMRTAGMSREKYFQLLKDC